MQFRLCDEELLYISALTNTDNLWGVEDPFKYRTTEEIPFELLRIQEQLLQKGMVEARPDGQLSPSKELIQLIQHCKQSERVFIFNSSLAVDAGTQLRFFDHSGTFVRYFHREEAELSLVNRELAFQEVSALFGEASPQDEPDFSLETGIIRLRRMGSLSRRHFLFELKNCGCEDSLAELIVDALQGQSEFCSLLSYDRSNGQETLTDKLVTLRFSDGNLIVTPGQSNIDSVCLSRLTEEKLKHALIRVFGMETEVAVV